MGVAGERTLTDVPYATAKMSTVEAKEINVVESNRSGGRLDATVVLDAMFNNADDAMENGLMWEARVRAKRQVV